MFNQPPPTPPTPNDGQDADSGTNWEQRFKGLQKTYSTAQASLDAAQSTATTLQQQYTALKDERANDARAHQEALAKANADLLTLKQQYAGLETTHKQAAEALALLQGKENARSELHKVDAGDLVSFVDSGHFNPGSATGDELKAKADEFRTQLTNWAKKSVTLEVGGSSPPGTQPSPSANTPGTNKDDLWEWVNNEANMDSPQWRANYNLALSLK